MLYATNTGSAPADVSAVVAASTSRATFTFQLPNHRTCDWAAILSSCEASAGRVARHASAVRRAFEAGSTHSVAPAMTFTPTLGVETPALPLLPEGVAFSGAVGAATLEPSPAQATRASSKATLPRARGWSTRREVDIGRDAEEGCCWVARPGDRRYRQS